LIRQREANGTVDHVLEFFLVDANGRALLQYMGEKAEPEQMANDLERLAAGESVTRWRWRKGSGYTLACARMKSSRVPIGSLIVLTCACAAVIFLARPHARGVTGSALTIRAVAHQWWWEFDYPSLGIRTSDVLYVPSATNVRLELASADVIHSFWIAGMKESVNILPGKTRPLNLVVKSPGELYGNCDSGCGCGTVCMRFRVLASNPGDFRQWATRERLSRSELKPPKKGDAPACALNHGHEGRAGHNIHASRLQRLLDGG
jgi:hypothetical protein